MERALVINKRRKAVRESLILWAIAFFYGFLVEHHGVMSYISFAVFIGSTVWLGIDLARLALRRRTGSSNT
ncbi:hypothetical protein AB0L71_15685 [Streptomyces sp. NPDC052052]|uniref:hypothetical protein n=1 Tax=Streptomyces sp. NPDC052052 TaxID=3154756 RepID=UPI003435FF9E